MNSNYVLDAFTLRNSENHSRLVLVMDAEKANGIHVSYKDYVNRSYYASQEEPEELKVREDRHFDYVSRESHKSLIVSLAKRYFSDKYRSSMPIVSTDQKLVCMPRFALAGGTHGQIMKSEDVIDVYDCSDERFWTSEKLVDIDDDFYLFSLDLGKKGYRTFRTMDFSRNNKYLAVQCEASLMIYDFNKACETEADVGDLGADGYTKLVEPHTKLNVADKTYDRILG